MTRTLQVFALAALAAGWTSPATAQKDKEPDQTTAISPDQTRLARGDANAVIITDVGTGKVLIRMIGHSDKVTMVHYSPDGKLLASGSADMTFAVWDTASGRQLLRRKLDAGISRVQFSPDGRTLTVREVGEGRRTFDVATGQEIKPK